ncbi:MAG: hypothetical protein QOD84_562 [Acidobacteriaceae bacterium]|jgi:VWFA-related protein
MPLPLKFRFCLAVAIVWYGAVALYGQAAEPTVRFTTTTDLVTVPVVLTDKSGKHIQGLGKDDFSVLQDGKEQKIAILEEVQRSSDVLPSTASYQKNLFSNLLPGNVAPRQLTIFVLDLINTPFLEQAKARQALLDFLKESEDHGQLTALLELLPKGTKVVRDFTADPSLLAAALKRVNGRTPQTQTHSSGANPDGSSTSDNPGSSDMFADFTQGKQDELQGGLEAFETRYAITLTMENLQAIARAYGGLPGRKALIWVSSGFPFSVSPGMVRRGRTRTRVDTLQTVLPLYEKTWQELNQAQIAVYPVDIRGLNNMGFLAARNRFRDPWQNFPPNERWFDAEILNTCRTFARETGGSAFYNSNDFKGAFKQAVEDNSHYYLLSYYLDRQNRKPGWHKLGVKVNHPGAEVRAKNGFFLTEPATDPVKAAQSEMQTALGSPMDYTALPITAQWMNLAPAEQGKKKAVFAIYLGPNSADVNGNDGNHLLVDIAATALTSTGTSAALTSQVIDDHLKAENVEMLRQKGLGFQGFLTLASGEYTVRFVVRDRLTGRMGSVSAPLKIQ